MDISYKNKQLHKFTFHGFGINFNPSVSQLKVGWKIFVFFFLKGDVSANVERKRAQAAAKISATVNPSGLLFTKVLIGNNKVNMDKEEIQNEMGYYPKQKQAGRRGDGIGRALVDMAGKTLELHYDLCRSQA